MRSKPNYLDLYIVLKSPNAPPQPVDSKQPQKCPIVEQPPVPAPYHAGPPHAKLAQTEAGQPIHDRIAGVSTA